MISQIPFPTLLICAQFPHHPLNVPFNSGVVNPVTLDMSTWKVTKTGGAAHAEQLPQQTTGKVLAADTASVLFVYAPVVIVQEVPGVKFSCPAQLS